MTASRHLAVETHKVVDEDALAMVSVPRCDRSYPWPQARNKGLFGRAVDSAVVGKQYESSWRSGGWALDRQGVAVRVARAGDVQHEQNALRQLLALPSLAAVCGRRHDALRTRAELDGERARANRPARGTRYP